MDSKSQDLHGEVVKYLKDELTKKLKTKNQTSKLERRDLRKFWLSRKIVKYLKNDFEIQKKFSIIPSKSNFFLSMRNSEHEVQEINDHAVEVCEKVKYSKKVLKDCEDYFQMKLDIHAENKLILTNILNSTFFLSLVICFILFVTEFWIPPIKHGSFLEKMLIVSKTVAGIVLLSGFSRIVSDVYKPYIDQEYLNSTISYRYCILILKSAQSKINERDEKTKKLSDIT